MLTDLLHLTDRQLAHLASVLAGGTIAPNSGLSQVQRAGFQDQSQLVHAWLSTAGQVFGTADGMLAAIRLVQAERARAAQNDPRPELVLSGPGSELMPGRDTAVVVREIFESAQQSVLIVGYAFYGSDRIFEPLALRMATHPGLSVSMLVNVHFDPDRPPESTIRKYAADFLRLSWPFHPRPSIYYLPRSLDGSAEHRTRVHAKMIVADRKIVFLGSANFTTAAFHRNIEAGIRLQIPSLAVQLIDHFEHLIRAGIAVPLTVDDL
jgi:phosphatidylserine/phosphatidylglycerophosphate/cardiolipin synthase-like enzyme